MKKLYHVEATETVAWDFSMELDSEKELEVQVFRALLDRFGPDAMNFDLDSVREVGDIDEEDE